jgi:hypothetical protein
MVKVFRGSVALLTLGGLAVLPACGGGSGSGSSAGQGIQLITGSGATGATGGSGSGYLPGSLGLFQINSRSYRIRQVGSIRTRGFVPALDYSGPAGCAGRIFEVNPTTVFRYTAHNAELQDGNTIFYFPAPPRVYQHTLAWHLRFLGTGENDDVTVAVYCPPPPASIPPIPQSQS